MRLPESVYADILRYELAQAGAPDPPAEPAEPARAERRREPRRSLGASVKVTRYGSPDRTPRYVGLHDLSPTGVGLVLRDSVVAPGERLVVHPRRGPAEVLSVLCTVRSVRVSRDGQFRVGAEFTSLGEAAAAAGVTAVRSSVGGAIRSGEGAPRTAGPRATAGRRDLGAGLDARAHERLRLSGRGTMYVCREDGGADPVEPVHVADLSDCGVGILRGAALAVGDQFVVRVPRVDEPPLTRLCAVTRVAAAGDGYRIGARFIPFSSRRGSRWLARLWNWVA